MESFLGFLENRDKLFPVGGVAGEYTLKFFLYFNCGQYIFIYKSRDRKTFLS